MKNSRLSIIASLAIGLCSVSSANSLSEALTNGKISGEFAITYENRDFDSEKEDEKYYRNSGYSVGSFALKYETGEWNNLSLTTKVRAYKTIFEEDDESTTSYGTGDATERFREKDGNDKNVDLEEFFLKYKIDNFSIKTGRQFISTDWVNKTQDAVRINASYGDTSLDAIWSLRHGRVYSRDYRPMTKFNENKGVYKIGLTHKLNENISLTAYDAIFPDVRDIIGGKINLKYEDTSLRAHYAVSNEDDNSVEDSNIIDLQISTAIAGFSPYAGYIKVDDDASFPGYAKEAAGEIIVPFEEGDYVYSKGAETYYLGVSKSFGDLSATLLYGVTEYYNEDDLREMNELTLWAGYPIRKDLKANIGYTIVDEDKNSSASDYNQLNATLTFSF